MTVLTIEELAETLQNSQAIAGLDLPDTGTITINGRDVTNIPPQRRGIGFVFQHYALFRHMTVFENVAFGLRVQPRAIRKDEATIAESRPPESSAARPRPEPHKAPTQWSSRASSPSTASRASEIGADAIRTGSQTYVSTPSARV